MKALCEKGDRMLAQETANVKYIPNYAKSDLLIFSTPLVAWRDLLYQYRHLAYMRACDRVFDPCVCYVYAFMPCPMIRTFMKSQILDSI